MRSLGNSFNRNSRLSIETSRRGFTLIEVLLALSLCSVVVAAAFSAVHLSWKFRSAGSIQVERSQIVRGVFQDMTLDLRSAAPFPDSQMILDAAMQSIDDETQPFFDLIIDEEQQQTLLEDTSDIEEQFLEFDSVGLVDPVYFFGETDFFVVLTNHENYRFAMSSSASLQEAQQQHVVWASRSNRSLRIPFGISNGRKTYVTFPAMEKPGLLRLSQAFDAAETASSNQQSDGYWTRIISDESSATFRYSDGTEWKTAWDSEEEEQCPAAVEVTLRREGGVEVNRFVIRIPHEKRSQASIRSGGVQPP